MGGRRKAGMWAADGCERQVIRRNFFLNVFDGALFAFGMSLASRTTVLPVFVKKMGGDNVAIGLLPVLWLIGFNLPQLFVANYSQQVPWKKPLMLVTALLQRLPWLLLAVLALFVVERVSPEWGLFLFFLGFTLSAIAGSVNLPVWFDLVAKITPVRLRGRLFAWRMIVGSTLGIAGGWVIERVLDTMAYPRSFALLFGAAFVVMMLSYVLLVFLREEHQEVAPERVRYREYVRRLPRILTHDRNYRNFLIAEGMLLTATMAEAFFTVDALASFSLSEGYAGRFTMVTMASLITGNIVFGYLADRFGHRLNLVLSAGWTALACLVALVAPTVEVYYLVFVCSAFTVGLRQVSRLPIVAELCGERDRPTYVALSNVVTAPFVLSGLAAGWLAERHGYDLVFALAAAAALVAAVWLLTRFREPRADHSPEPAS